MTGIADNSLMVQPVSGRKQLKEFIALPQRLYAEDRNWVTPLWFEQHHRYSKKNPFFQHAKWQAWLVRRGSLVVGRISAQVDDLYDDPDGKKIGYFGSIEAENDAEVFALLFSTAEDWLRERGMQSIRGPFNLSVNEECGLLIEGYQTPPYMMMGHAHEYYAKRIEACGYSKAKDLYAYEVRPDFNAPPVMQRLLRNVRKDVSVRALRRKQLKQELELLRDIFNDSWSSNWGFTPFTEAEFADIGEFLTLLIRDEFIQIAEIDGRAVAMIVAVPDINSVITGLNGKLFPLGWLKLLWRLKVKRPSRARVMLMGVRKEYQHTRMGPALALLTIDTVRQELHEHKIDHVEMSWVLEDNEGMKSLAESFGGNLYKRYRIYENAL
jgi:hypothetical protein